MLVNFIRAIIIYIIVLVVMRLMGNIKSVSIRKITCGKPTILVYRGKIDEEALKKERFTVSELQERLRGKDVFNLGDVEYAILETNGEVSVIQKPNKRNTIPEDFNIEPDYEGLPYDLIVDGKIMYENLSKIGKDEKWLQKQIVKFKTTPENVLIATMDGKGNFFCQNKTEKRKKRKW